MTASAPASTADMRPVPSPDDPGGKRVCVARIGAAHGTRGEVRLWSFTVEPRAVAGYAPLETADGARVFQIESLRPAKDFFVARLSGVADRDAAELLRNVDLFVPRDRLPAAADEEFYHADLIGLTAEDSGGGPVGTIVAVHNFGAGDLLEVAPRLGGATFMLPFTLAAVPKIDLAAGRVVVALPAGLLDAAAAEPDQPPE